MGKPKREPRAVLELTLAAMIRAAGLVDALPLVVPSRSTLAHALRALGATLEDGARHRLKVTHGIQAKKSVTVFQSETNAEITRKLFAQLLAFPPGFLQTGGSR